MIGGWVGVAEGSGEGDSPGMRLAPGSGDAPGDPDGRAPGGAGGVGTIGSGVATVPGGLTGPLGAGAGGFTGCAVAPRATTQINARLENGAKTRRKRLPSSAGDHAIFWVGAASRVTADAKSVL